MEEQNNTLPQAPVGPPSELPASETKTENPQATAQTNPDLSAQPVVVTPQAAAPALQGSEASTLTSPTPASPVVAPGVDGSSVPASSEVSTPANNVVQNTTTSEASSLTSTPVTPPSAEQPLDNTVVPAPAPDTPVIPVNSSSTTPTVSEQANIPTAPTTVNSDGGGHHSPLSKLPKFSRRTLGLALMLFALLLSIGSSAYFALGQRSAKNELASLKQKLEAMDANVHDLPEGAIKLSECVPNMGFHYIEQGADPKFGPLLLVNTKGKVIGFEYMFNESMLTEIPDAGIPLEVLLTNGPVLLKDWQYNSIDFSRATAGHPGFEDDHYDVHLYTVDPEEQKRACE